MEGLWSINTVGLHYYLLRSDLVDCTDLLRCCVAVAVAAEGDDGGCCSGGELGARRPGEPPVWDSVGLLRPCRARELSRSWLLISDSSRRRDEVRCCWCCCFFVWGGCGGCCDGDEDEEDDDDGGGGDDS